MKSIIVQKILENVKAYPNNNALWVDKRYYTYQELFDRSASLACLFQTISHSNSFCAVLSDKNIFAFQAILGLMFSGKAYVPLNPQFPIERNIKVLEEGDYEFVCVDVKQELAEQILTRLKPTKICLSKKELYHHLSKTIPKHTYLLWDESIYPKLNSDHISVHQDDYAYLMFTSGSTGQPKGIAIKHKNLSQYISSLCELYKPTNEDRFSQLSELTFDLSVHEMFICWMAGASLHVVPESYILGIKNFIQKHEITHWTAVPSNISLLHQLKQLEPNNFPSIKLSYLCGESFLQSQAKQWRLACPNTKIANLYGPTETTVGFTYFDWHQEITELSGVPIGTPLPGQTCALIDSNENLVKPGELGELCLAGSQVVEQYWNNPEKTLSSFKQFPWDDHNQLWYRTGDLATWDDRYGYIYHGRIDDQWQIRGYRVEKLEIENELRKIAQHDAVAIVPLESDEGLIIGVIAFTNEEIDTENLLKNARKLLPSHMVPKQIYQLNALPQNLNGKIDYPILKKTLNQLKALNYDELNA